MKYFKDVHVVLEETEYYDEGEGVKVTLDTSENGEKLGYDINIVAEAEGGYSSCCCKIPLKDLIYKIKDIIPYEWIADIKEGKENDK